MHDQHTSTKYEGGGILKVNNSDAGSKSIYKIWESLYQWFIKIVKGGCQDQSWTEMVYKQHAYKALC